MGPPRLCWGMIGAPRPRLELTPRSVWPWAPSCPAARQHPHLQVSLSSTLSSQKVGETSRRGLDHQGLEPKEEIQQIALHSPHRTFQLLCFMTLKVGGIPTIILPSLPFQSQPAPHLVGLGFYRKTGASGSLRSTGSSTPRILTTVIHPAASRSLLRK